MRIQAIALAAVIALLSTAALAEEYYLGATLKGANEVPGPGDPKATSAVDLTLDTDKMRVCFNFETTGLDKVSMAHVHKGGSGVAGDPVVTFAVDARGNGKSCMDIAKDIAEAIAARPEDYYVNLHNEAFPKGAIRGQLAEE